MKKKKINKKYKVCDSQTLHAHAVRLNPIHVQGGEKISDVMQFLESSSLAANTGQDSPKKSLLKNSKKSGNSPKKILAKSPSSSSENSSLNLSPSPSKALQTAKKLHSLIDESEDEKSVKKLKLQETTSEESDLNNSKESSTDKTTDEQEQAWTRDEDKLILEEIRSGRSKDDIVKSLGSQLQRRNEKEIFERYQFLLNFLTRLSSSASTTSTIK